MSNIYYVGDGSSYHDPNSWATSSGGTPGAGEPGFSDTAIFDNNSFTVDGRIVVVGDAGTGYTGACRIFDASALTNHTASLDVQVYGITFRNQFKASSQMDLITSDGIGSIVHDSFLGITSVDIDIQGNIGDIHFVLNKASTVYHILSDFISTAYLDIQQTGSYLNTHSLTVQASMIVALRVDAGSSDIYIVGRSSDGYAEIAIVTFNYASSTVYINGSADFGLSEAYSVHIIDTPSGLFSGTRIPENVHMYGNYTVDAGDVYYGTAGGVGNTVTVDGTFSAPATVGNNASFSARAGSGATYSIDAAVVGPITYLDVSDCTAGGAAAPFNDLNGVDGGGNTNWNFINPALTTAVSADLEVAATPAFPEITNIFNVTYEGATIEGYIPTDFNYDEIGLVWGEGGDPTIIGGDPYIIIYGIIGPFYVNITGLIPGHTYHVRVYVRNGVTYEYGITIVFTVPIQNAIAFLGQNQLGSKYQFELLDQNNNLIADLSGYIDNREFSITRNRADEIYFSINLDTLSQLAQDLKMNPKDLLQTGIQTVRIRRGGVPLLAGQNVYWDADLSNERVVNVKVKGWLELLYYRTFSGVYQNKTAAYIARDIIAQTQALSNGNFGITLGANPTGTNTYTEKIFENKLIGEAFVEMSEENAGFDFKFTWDKQFNLYYPGIGVYRQDIIFSYPGNTKGITISSDASQIMNSLLARGKGNASANINTIISDTASQMIYKLRTAVKDYPDMDKDQLVNTAAAELFHYKNPLTLYTVKYSGNNPACPPVGSFNVGDRVRISVNQLELFSDLNTFFTIDQMHVSINKEDDEEVTLSLSPILTS